MAVTRQNRPTTRSGSRRRSRTPSSSPPTSLPSTPTRGPKSEGRSPPQRRSSNQRNNTSTPESQLAQELEAAAATPDLNSEATRPPTARRLFNQAPAAGSPEDAFDENYDLSPRAQRRRSRRLDRPTLGGSALPRTSRDGIPAATGRDPANGLWGPASPERSPGARPPRVTLALGPTSSLLRRPSRTSARLQSLGETGRPGSTSRDSRIRNAEGGLRSAATVREDGSRSSHLPRVPEQRPAEAREGQEGSSDEHEVVRLRIQLAEQTEMRDGLIRQYLDCRTHGRALEERIEALEGQVELLQTENRDLQGTGNSYQEALDRATGLEFQVGRLRETAQGRREEVDRALNRITELETDAGGLQEELDATIANRDEILDQATRWEFQVGRLQETVRGRREELNAALNRITELETDAGVLQGVFEATIADRDEALIRIEELEFQVGRLQETVRRRTESIDQAMNRVTQLETDARGIQEELEATRADRDEGLDLIRELDRLNRHRRDTQEEAETTAAGLDEIIEEREQQINDLHARVRALEAENQRLRSREESEPHTPPANVEDDDAAEEAPDPRVAHAVIPVRRMTRAEIEAEVERHNATLRAAQDESNASNSPGRSESSDPLGMRQWTPADVSDASEDSNWSEDGGDGGGRGRTGRGRGGGRGRGRARGRGRGRGGAGRGRGDGGIGRAGRTGATRGRGRPPGRPRRRGRGS